MQMEGEIARFTWGRMEGWRRRAFECKERWKKDREDRKGVGPRAFYYEYGSQRWQIYLLANDPFWRDPQRKFLFYRYKRRFDCVDGAVIEPSSRGRVR